jgi:acyl-CoA synthetase (NDP forming)
MTGTATGLDHEAIHQLLHPVGVAIVGGIDRNAGEDGLRARYDLLYGAGNWHLVSPKGGTVGGLPVHESLDVVPGPLDLAILSTPPGACPAVVFECGARGIHHVVVFSSGFREVGGRGVEFEEALAAAGRQAGVRILGPNTNTNAFEPQAEIPGYRYGKIGVVTQSGHNGRPIVQGSHVGIAFSRQVPCGNEVDLDVCDFIHYYAHDPDTAVVAGYIEGFRSIDKLRAALQACNDAGKPVVLLKIGSTDAGAAMAQSHTGHLTGADAAIDGLFEQYGVIRVRDLDELLETAGLLAKLPAGTGSNVALYSISGGSGTLMAEQAQLAGLPVPELSATTQAALHEHLPAYLTVRNPVDNGGTFIMRAGPGARRAVLTAILDDPGVDILVVGITGAMGLTGDPLCEDLRDMAAERLSKPVITTWNSPKVDERGYDLLLESQLPMFRSFRNCFTAIRRIGERRDRVAQLRTRPSLEQGSDKGAPLPHLPRSGGVLGADESRQLLAAYGVPLTAERVATDADDAVAAATFIGFPVVLKIASADIPHKSDEGLVRLGLADADEVRRAHDELRALVAEARPDARVGGVLVQSMVSGGQEMIVGISRDAALGHALLVGLGGIYAEVFADTAVRPLPVDEQDVREMIRSLACFPLLDGARGRPKLAVDALVTTALATARLATGLGDRLAELDLNPVVLTEDAAVAVDSLVVLAADAGAGATTASHTKADPEEGS